MIGHLLVSRPGPPSGTGWCLSFLLPPGFPAVPHDSNPPTVTLSLLRFAPSSAYASSILLPEYLQGWIPGPWLTATRVGSHLQDYATLPRRILGMAPIPLKILIILWTSPSSTYSLPLNGLATQYSKLKSLPDWFRQWCKISFGNRGPFSLT